MQFRFFFSSGEASEGGYTVSSRKYAQQEV